MITFIHAAMAMEDEDQKPKLKTVLENQTLYEWNKGNIHLFDGVSGNNQCHSNALIIAKLYNDWLIEQSEIAPQDLNYLSLNLLLSSAWISCPKKINLAKRIQLTLQNTNNNQLLKRASCITKLSEDPAFSLKDCAKKSKSEFNRKVFKKIQRMVNQFPSTELNDQLQNLLQNTEEVPKFVSSIIFIEQNKIWQIPIVLRVKHICEHGTDILNFMVQDTVIIDFDNSLLPSDKVLVVIDAISSNSQKLKNFNQFQDLRSKCPHNFMPQNNTKNTVHSCENCKIVYGKTCSCVLNFKSNLMALQFEDIFYAIGASFTDKLQSELIDFLQNFPHIFKSYSHFLQLAQQGMSSADISLLFIEHVYPARVDQITKKRLVDCSGSYILKGLEK